MAKIKPLAVVAVLLFAAGLLAGEDAKALEKAWEKLPSAERHFAQGLRDFQAGRYDQASAAFRECVQELPRHAYAHYYLANISYILKDHAGALAGMEEALKHFPFMQEINDFAVSMKRRELDSYNQMLEAEWENTTSCRTSREIEELAGDVYDTQNKLELEAAGRRAAQAVQKAHYLYFMGNIYFQLQRYVEAEKKYEESIALNPRHASAYNNAAAIFYMAGDHRAALAFLERAEKNGLEDNLNLKLKHLIHEALGLPTEGILQEDLTPGGEGGLGVMRFALAFKGKDSLLPPLYSNGYVVFDRASRQAVVIDPGVDDPRIVEFVEKEKLEVKAILDTHGHEDHTAANSRFAKLFGARVLVHGQDAKSLAAPPDGLLEDRQTLIFEGFTVGVIHTPGHTPGGVSFSIRDFLFSGDTLFRSDIGRVAAKDPREARAARAKLVQTIKDKLLTLPGATRVCPGHGRTTTIAAEKAGNPFLTK